MVRPHRQSSNALDTLRSLGANGAEENGSPRMSGADEPGPPGVN